LSLRGAGFETTVFAKMARRIGSALVLGRAASVLESQFFAVSHVISTPPATIKLHIDARKTRRVQRRGRPSALGRMRAGGSVSNATRGSIASNAGSSSRLAGVSASGSSVVTTIGSDGIESRHGLLRLGNGCAGTNSAR